MKKSRSKPHQGKLEIQRDPYDPFVPSHARAIILGSTPPARFCLPSDLALHPRDIDWFYGSCDRGCNTFWEAMFRVYDPDGLAELNDLRDLELPREEKTRRQRDFLQNWLKLRSLGIMDILDSFERRDGSGTDAKLKPLSFRDPLPFLQEAPKVKAFCCTSLHKVHTWLGRSLALHGIQLEQRDGEFCFELKDEASKPRLIWVYRLPSPSPIGRIRFPNHQAWMEHLVSEYRRIYAMAGVLSNQ
ncbi:MAG: hypothetical protein GXY81_00675 [Candidatus Cloacimonetes bacterium]|nr:hypothetical protein [Candidatus Cloacimonadota bacterium]